MNLLKVGILEDDVTTAKVYEEYLRRIPGVRCEVVLHGKEEAARYVAAQRHLASRAQHTTSSETGPFPAGQASRSRVPSRPEPVTGSADDQPSSGKTDSATSSPHTRSPKLRHGSADLSGVHLDLLLVDMNLPDGHGLEVMRMLRSGGWQGGAIALTAAGERAVVRGAMASGVFDYLLKPFTFEDFAARVIRFRDLQRRLGGTGAVPDQEQLDTIFAPSMPTRDVQLPKGLVAETLVRVREALDVAKNPLSARETAETVGISRVTARRYLEHLVDTGQASRHSRHGTQGRPEVEYARPASS